MAAGGAADSTQRLCSPLCVVAGGGRRSDAAALFSVVLEMDSPAAATSSATASAAVASAVVASAADSDETETQLAQLLGRLSKNMTMNTDAIALLKRKAECLKITLALPTTTDESTTVLQWYQERIDELEGHVSKGRAAALAGARCGARVAARITCRASWQYRPSRGWRVCLIAGVRSRACPCSRDVTREG